MSTLTKIKEYYFFRSALKTIFLILLIFIELHSNNFDNKKIRSIIVLGNNSTKEDVIKRELLMDVGDPFVDSLRILSEKRVTNLFLFNHVEIIAVPEDKDISLIVSVTERLHLFPFPKFIIEDRDWNKITYGFGFAHTNFRGRNEKLIGTVLFGYRPGYQIDYFNPWIGGTDHLTSGFSVKSYEADHNLLGHNEKYFNITGSVGKYWTRYINNNFNISYTQIKTPPDVAPKMLTGKSKENLVSMALSVAYDTRDLLAYPAQGWDIEATYIKKGFFEKDIDYAFYLLDARKYITVYGLTLAIRGHTLLSDAVKLPIYDRVYLGFNERVRGHFNEIVAGEHRVLASAEIRFPLTDTYIVDLPSVLLPESSTRNLKFGINGALFYDSGRVWGNDLSEYTSQGSRNNGKIIDGFGAAIHFRLPYVEVARLEMAFDRKLNSEIIFELGTAL